jgi:hypothetical protein
MAQKPPAITSRDHYLDGGNGRMPPGKPESPHRLDLSVRGGMYGLYPWSLGSSRRSLTPETGEGRIGKLRRLNDTRYHERPAPLNGGMVDLALIVTRSNEVNWFRDRDLLTDGQLWAERESELNALPSQVLRKVYTDKSEAERSLLLAGPALNLGQRFTRQSLGALMVLLKEKRVIEKGVHGAFSRGHVVWIPGGCPKRSVGSWRSSNRRPTGRRPRRKRWRPARRFSGRAASSTKRSAVWSGGPPESGSRGYTERIRWD